MGASFLTLIVIALSSLTTVAESKPALKSSKKTQTYFLADTSGAPYEDTCSRRLEKRPSIHVCLKGNGRYNTTLIDEEFLPLDWFYENPSESFLPDEVHFVCVRERDRIPPVARLIFPDAQELALGKKPRIEFPCDWEAAEVAVHMRDIVKFLKLKTKDPKQALASVDQISAACAQGSGGECERLSQSATRIITSRASPTDEVPVLTFGRVQISSGLKRLPPPVGREILGRKKSSQDDSEPKRVQARASARLNARLGSCGLSKPEEHSAVPRQLLAVRDDLEINTELWNRDRCIAELESERQWLAKQGITFDRNGAYRDGELLDIKGISSDELLVEAGFFKLRNLTALMADLALDMKKEMPKATPKYADDVRRIFSEAGWIGQAIPTEAGKEWMNRLTSKMIFCEEKPCVAATISAVMAVLFAISSHWDKSPDHCFILRDLSLIPGKGDEAPSFNFDIVTPCGAARPPVPAVAPTPQAGGAE